MVVKAIRTETVEANSCKLTEFLRKSIKSLKEGSIVAVSSKVISLCEGNVVKIDEGNKDELIEKESDFYLPKSSSKYNVYLTIKNNMIIPSAGIDESNTNGYYVKWPNDPQNSANECWKYIRQTFGLNNVGVIITDSVTSPLRWGVTGRYISHCGFRALNDKVGEKDLFGKELVMTKINVADSLASAAVLCMGESNERTPVAVIEDVPFVKFSQQTPSQIEIDNLKIDMEDDLYGQLLVSVDWKSYKFDKR